MGIAVYGRAIRTAPAVGVQSSRPRSANRRAVASGCQMPVGAAYCRRPNWKANELQRVAPPSYVSVVASGSHAA